MKSNSGTPHKVKDLLGNFPIRVILIGTSLLLLPAAIAAAVSHQPTHGWWMDLLLIVYNLTSTVVIFTTAAWLKKQDQRLSMAWLFIGISMFSYTLGDSIWAFLEMVLKIYPFPSIADFFYLAFYPLFLVGVVLFPGDPPRGRDRIKVTLDILIISITVGLYLWHFILAPIVSEAIRGITPELLLSLAYPLFDLFILAVVILILTLSHPGVRSSSKYILLAASLVTILADSLYVSVELNTGFLTGRWVDVIYASSYILFGLSALSQRWSKANEKTMTRGLVDITDFHRYFTAALIGASFILWVVLEYTNTEYNRAILFGMIGLIAIFSFVIQILDGMDISHLNRQLRSFNNDLEETIKSRTAEVEDLYNNAPVGYHSVGLDLVFKMMNQTELNWLGYTREQVIGKMKLTDLLPPKIARIFQRY